MADVLAEFLSGALGSVTTKVFVFPFETARVILAVNKHEYKHLSLAKSFNGLLVACVDTALYNGANFAGYFFIKQQIHSARAVAGPVALPPLQALLAGMIAGTCASAVAMPLNVITTKRQASNGSARPLCAASAAAAIVKDDGWAGLWRGFPAAIYKNVDPAITFFVFDWLRAAQVAPPSAAATFILGLVAKVVAIVVSYPLILAQARIHAQDKSGTRAKRAKDGGSGKDCRAWAYNGVADVLQQVLEVDGFCGLYSGLTATIAGESIKNALKFSLKEQFAAIAARVAVLLLTANSVAKA